MGRWRSWIVAVLLVAAGWPGSLAAQDHPARTVVVLLFDGWAPALLEGLTTPALARIRTEGAWTHHLIPVFPTLSLVNQVSISTGCWPEHHGIVTNEFIDPTRGRYDHSRDADWLTGCEHLHQVAERQGVPSAALGWVGGVSGSRGKLATYVSAEATWADSPDDAHRAEQVIQLLRLPDAERPRLILAYFKGPDTAAHFTGMDSERTRRAVLQSDAAVGSVLQAIDGLPFRDQVTLLVTTDHGMLPVWINVNVARILRNHDIDATAVSSGTTSFLYFREPTPPHIQEAMRALHPYFLQFDVIERGQAQPDWHIGSGARVGDLILSAHPPYFIEDGGHWPAWLRWLTRWGPELLWSRMSMKATHGYPPKTQGMAGILYAWGAGIAPAREIVNLRAIDIHPTVCRLLGVEPGAAVDGTVATQLLAE